MQKKSLIIIVLVAMTIIAGIVAVKELKSASQSYIYGYPLVLMDKTRQATFGEHDLSNQIYHIQKFPDHSFRNVVRPNNDTLYSIAWLDLTNEAQILLVPEMPDRYYVMPFMDAWTNVFATIGTRETGLGAGSYLITGPNWQGDIPADIPQIKSPTNMVWMIGRIQTNGVEDIEYISNLQAGFKLTSLSNWPDNTSTNNLNAQNHQLDETTDPYQQIDNMDSGEFFEELSKLLVSQNSLDADAEALKSLDTIGIVPGQLFDTTQRSWVERAIHNYALRLTRQKIIDNLAQRRERENGWVVLRHTIGNYGTNYGLRAAVARIGLGALPPEEAVYPNTDVDFNLQKLSGEYSYIVHFDGHELPPAQAFWSITMYDEEGFLIDNLINRYVIGDRDSLNFNDDGSLDIIVQHTPPLDESINWLPAPNDEFALTMRLYMPEERFLDGSWELPPVVRQ